LLSQITGISHTHLIVQNLCRRGRTCNTHAPSCIPPFSAMQTLGCTAAEDGGAINILLTVSHYAAGMVRGPGVGSVQLMVLVLHVNLCHNSGKAIARLHCDSALYLAHS
jgi:hypothetical protein